MEITRLQPFPLVFQQDGFESDTDYVLAILDDHAGDLVEVYVTSDEEGSLSAELPAFFAKYDDEYRAEIYLKNDEVDDIWIRGDMVWTDTLSIIRPYINPAALAETPEEEDKIKMYESVARFMINSITGGFMYKREVFETTGLGNDYLPIPFRLNKIIRVYENGVIVYDSEPIDPDWKNIREYYISPDKSSITVNIPTVTGVNRFQSRPNRGRFGSSDSFTQYNTNDSPNFSEAIYDTKTFVDMTGNTSMFPDGWDYTIVVDAGWPIIPQDIQRATRLLIEDFACNNLPYANAYIKEYESDQFSMKIDAEAFKDNTGNRIVDQILSAYPRPLYRLGVL